MRSLNHITSWVLVLLSIGTLHAATLDQAVAFVSNRDGNAHIYITRGDNTDKALTQGNSNNMHPAWSPDGKLLAFTSLRDGNSAIYIMQADGTQLRRLNDSTNWQSAPSWSPDGKSLAYFSRQQGKPGVALHIASLLDDSIVVLADDGRDKGPNGPVWSGDGSLLAYIALGENRKTDVWLVHRDGSQLSNISQQVSKRNKAHPAFSPDGKHLSYIADMRDHVAIMLTNLSSGESINLTAGQPAKYEHPRWSPSGKQLVFASTRDDATQTRMDVFVMNADGSNAVNLSRHPNEDFNPHWTADGKSIVFTSLRSGTAQIYAYDLQKKSAVRITTNTAHDMDQVPQPATTNVLQAQSSANIGDLNHAN